MPIHDSREVADDYTAQERAALITLEIFAGAELTTAEIAQRVGVTYQGARAMMDKISRVVPVYVDNGLWRCSKR